MLVISCLFDNRHCITGEVISHYGFDTISLIINDVGIFFGKYIYSDFLSIFLIKFLLLRYVSSVVCFESYTFI